MKQGPGLGGLSGGGGTAGPLTHSLLFKVGIAFNFPSLSSYYQTVRHQKI